MFRHMSHVLWLICSWEKVLLLGGEVAGVDTFEVGQQGDGSRVPFQGKQKRNPHPVERVPYLFC